MVKSVEGNILENVLTIKTEDDSANGNYKCRLATLDSDKSTQLVVKKGKSSFDALKEVVSIIS